MTPVCIILQGIPGSGKSTFAARLSSRIASADRYVDYSQPVAPQLSKAHAWCFKDAIAFAMDGRDFVVDNTNLTSIEIAPYHLLARSFHFDVEIRRIHCPPETAWGRQTHGVPRQAFDSMVARFESFEPAPWWSVKNYYRGTGG